VVIELWIVVTAVPEVIDGVVDKVAINVATETTDEVDGAADTISQHSL
jgi:hypothetical protein